MIFEFFNLLNSKVYDSMIEHDPFPNYKSNLVEYRFIFIFNRASNIFVSILDINNHFHDMSSIKTTMF